MKVRSQNRERLKSRRARSVSVGANSRFEWWRETYEGVKPEDLPWFSPLPDRDFLEALNRYAPNPGRALDLGCGPGIHSIELAKRRWRVTAIDVAPGAISMAASFAAKSGISVEFLNTDVLKFKPTQGGFDLVLDRGFLHTLPRADRRKWSRLVTEALRPDGIVIAKEFLFDRRRAFGPRGLTEAEIRAVFSHGLRIERTTRSSFGRRGTGHEALLVVARRR
jgi:2-polyprenyl-3-methyl-5-hydroxy-6-metoxy-1,4-benzoquinol methylase